MKTLAIATFLLTALSSCAQTKFVIVRLGNTNTSLELQNCGQLISRLRAEKSTLAALSKSLPAGAADSYVGVDDLGNPAHSPSDQLLATKAAASKMEIVAIKGMIEIKHCKLLHR